MIEEHELQEGADEAPEETEATETEATESPQAGEDAVPIEDKARGMGWVPKEEFRGDPDNWRPADEFVKRGEEFLPFVKKDRDKFRAEVDELREKLDSRDAEFKRTLERVERMNEIALEQQRQQLVNQYTAQKEQAVELGDVDTYRALSEQEREALSELDKKTAPPETTETPGVNMTPAQKRTVEQWTAENSWYGRDTTMQAVANAYHEKLLNEKPGMDLAENLAEVREEVRRRFPEKFGKVKTNGKGSPVEGGTRSERGGTSGLWGKLPPEVREVAERQIAEGQFALDADGNEIKDKAKRRERYAEMYLEG